MTTTTAALTHPAGCTNHPTNEPDTHQSAAWQSHGLRVQIADHYQDGLMVSVDGNGQSIDLNMAQAHQLGLELIRAAARVREAQR
jgi:hypothetical protein